MSLKVSVIIPVYQVERYLKQCIDSVIAQDYQNLEIILVDDGAYDDSPQICDQYAGLYPNIKVIHKSNGGLSSARNVGIKMATGDYVAFLDGDDYWNDTAAVSRLVERVSLSNADVLNFSYKMFFEDTEEEKNYFEHISAMPCDRRDKESQLDYMTKNHLYIASACNKLIKKELLSEKILFEESVFSEDIEWSARLLLQAKSMDFICENFYCYRQRKDSIRHTITDKKCNDLCKHIFSCFSLLEGCEKSEKEALLAYTAYQYGTFFIAQAQAQNVQSDCISRLAQYRWILSYHFGNKKVFLLSVACKLLGYKKVCSLIRRVYRKNGE